MVGLLSRTVARCGFDFALGSRHDARTRRVAIEIYRARLISQIRSFEFASDHDDGPTVGASCQCLNQGIECFS
jgi:hypothetical protein